MSNSRPNTTHQHSHVLQPIHPMAVRHAFGGDPEHPAVVGRIIGVDGQSQIVATRGGWAAVDIDDPAFVTALRRKDLCRWQGHELLVLLNIRYGLVGLAVGPARAPGRLEIDARTVRLENGSAVEIPSREEQPGWLLFRCRAEILAEA